MTLPLTPSSPFVAFTTAIPSAVLNAWRVAINSACDGVGGGVYTPTVTLEINGQGLYADPFGGYVRSTWTLTIDSGGSFITNAGATATFNSAVSFNGNTQFDGSTNTVTAGTWGFYAPCYVLGGTELKIGDSIAGVGHFVIDGSGSGAGSTMLLDGNATCTFATGTSLIMNSGSTATLNGASTVSNLVSATQTGPFIRSGTAAITGLRIGTPANPHTTQTFDPTQWDIITINNLTSFPSTATWTFSNPMGVSSATVIVVGTAVGVVGSGKAVQINNAGASNIGALWDTTGAGKNGPGTLMFYWDAADGWQCLNNWGAASTYPN